MNPAAEARAKAQAIWPGASVSARGRKSITHQHPSDPNRFMLDTAIGPMHYDGDQEIDTAWQPGTAPWDFEMVKAGYNAFALEDFSSGQIIKYVDPDSGEDIAFEPQQLQYTNDLDQIQAIADPQAVTAVVQNEDELFWSGAYGTGFDLRWQCQTARLDKRLIVDQASRFPAVQQFITDGGNPVLRLQFIFQKSSGVDIYVNEVLWNEKVNNPVETSGLVEFRSKTTGLPVWHFNLPRSFQPPQEDVFGEFIGVFKLRKTGPNLFIEHRIPVSWLQSANYPIEIDVTLDDQVDIGAGDCYEEADGDMILGSNGVAFGNFGLTRSVGLFFPDISGLSGATINTTNTNLVFRAAATDPQDFVSDFYAHDVEAPGIFDTTTSNITDTGQRPRTTATCEGDGADFGNWTADSDETFTGDGTNTIGDIIQELADSYDPSEIAILNIYVSGNGERVFLTYESDTGLAPKLHIEYTAGGANAPTADIQGPLVGPLGGPIAV